MPIEHLPPTWSGRARRFRDWCATDKGLLLLLAGVFLARSLSYIGRPSVVQHVLEVRAGWFAPALWWGVTLLLFAALRRDCPRLENIALSTAVCVLMLWGVLFLWTTAVPVDGFWPEWSKPFMSALLVFLSRGSVFIGCGLLAIYTVWRGRSGTLRIKEG